MSPTPIQHPASAASDVEESISALWRLETSASRSFNTGAGLTPAAYGIMALLEPPARLCLSDLADKLALGKPGLSRQVNALVDDGLVARVSNPHKHNARELRLTPLGQEVLALDRSRRHERLQHAMAGWSSASITDLVRLLTKLNDCYGRQLTRQYVLPEQDRSAPMHSGGRPAG